MRPYRVRYAGKAVRDLMDLWDYLAEAAGPDTATRYIDRLDASVQRLAFMPYRGTERPELGPRWRTFGFERRATIVFVIEEESRSVTILRVFYGGRSINA